VAGGSVKAVRIVSLLPSTTEILFAVGAGESVVGVTFECDFPPEARTRAIVSTSALTPGLDPGEIDAEVRARLAAGEDLYHLDEGALRRLSPDLVVTQDLCAVCAVDVSTVDEALAHLGCEGNVLTVDPMTLSQVVESILTLGRATGRERRAGELVATLESRLSLVAAAVAGHRAPRVAVVEWTDPLFSAGHWVPDMVAAAGAICALGGSGQRSVQIAPSELTHCGAEIVVVAPCGYRLAGARALAVDLMAQGVIGAGASVWAVDADAAFVRPGPRLIDGVEALAAICHPGQLPLRPELAAFVGTTPVRAGDVAPTAHAFPEAD
jgi:iron complex transport system substrate-binding protein